MNGERQKEGLKNPKIGNYIELAKHILEWYSPAEASALSKKKVTSDKTRATRNNQPSLSERESDVKFQTYFIQYSQNWLLAEKLMALQEDPDKTSKLIDLVNDALAVLSPKRRTVLQLRFGLTGGQFRSPQEVGRLLNCSRERIRQLETEAFRGLQKASRSEVFIGRLNELIPGSKN